MAKRKHYKRSSSLMGGVGGQIVGAGAVVLYEAYVSPMIPLNEPYKSAAEILLGVYMGKKGGIVGNAGKALVTINAYQLLKAYLPLGQAA